MIIRRRVVETYDPGADRRGTGFLLSSSLVLTAAQCVPSGRGAAVAVRSEVIRRPWSGGPWMAAPM